ncbi:MAG: hypothetical protein R6W75_03565 [Smithellaceae bacterium]
MNQEAPDQGWQKLQAHIDGFFNQLFANDVRRIEYKPRYIALLGMAAEQQENEIQENNI